MWVLVALYQTVRTSGSDATSQRRRSGPSAMLPSCFTNFDQRSTKREWRFGGCERLPKRPPVLKPHPFWTLPTVSTGCAGSVSPGLRRCPTQAEGA